MSELPEIHTHSKHGSNDPDREQADRVVGLFISVIAIFLAVCSGLGHRADNNEIVARVNASNTWAYYQAKKIRSFQSEVGGDLVALLSSGSGSATQTKANALTKKYSESVARYESESKEITERAKEFEKEGDHFETRGDRFDIAEVFLQIAVVLCSIMLLTRLRLFLYIGLGFSTVGLLVMASALLVH